MYDFGDWNETLLYLQPGVLSQLPLSSQEPHLDDTFLHVPFEYLGLGLSSTCGMVKPYVFLGRQAQKPGLRALRHPGERWNTLGPVGRLVAEVAQPAHLSMVPL